MQVIQQDLKAVGIQLTTDNLSQNDFLSRLYNGDYQLAYNNQQRRPVAVLRVPAVAVLGQLGADRQAGLEQLGAVQQPGDRRADQPVRDDHLDTAQQQQIVDQLQHVLLKDVPFIPVTEEVAWYQYNTSKFTGWVTPERPLCRCRPRYFYPDMGQVLLHLAPAK